MYPPPHAPPLRLQELFSTLGAVKNHGVNFDAS